MRNMGKLTNIKHQKTTTTQFLLFIDWEKISEFVMIGIYRPVWTNDWSIDIMTKTLPFCLKKKTLRNILL